MTEQPIIPDPITTLANDHFGIDYLFPYQRLAISNILEAAGVPGFAPQPRDNPVTGEPEVPDTTPHQIVILPTGAGKSLCFMLPAAVMEGASLVVFPLLSLIADQARRVIEAKMKPGILRGGQSRSEREEVWEGVKSGQIRMILTNPETALSPRVLPKLKELNIRHLVIDEMHTVSEWGESFRPVYMEIGKLAPEAGIPLVTAFTATASPLILSKVKKIVFPGKFPNIITANPDRPNIRYRVIPCLSKNHELVKLLDGDENKTGETNQPVQRPAIVFCSSRTGTELTAALLRRRLKEDQIYFYHAGLTREEKADIEKWFFDSNDGILTATCAYGMGVDKSNIRTVIHMDIPSSIEAYLQESGRGGRDRKPAEAVLLISSVDSIKTEAIQDRIERERRRGLLQAALNRTVCRREQFLSLLGGKPEGCFGCDVCDGTAATVEDGKEEILGMIRRNRRTYSEAMAGRVLAGNRGIIRNEVFAPGMPGFGMLRHWHPDDIREALSNLMMEKELKTVKSGPWKGKVTMGNPG